MIAPFRKEDLMRLATIVADLTGNNVQEKNHTMLESRLKSRMIALKIADIESYWRYYETNQAGERHVLQGLMTTHYTFFFREYLHFEALEKWIENNHKRLKSRLTTNQEPVRIWSAACSRGQEVYSLAMFLETALFARHGIPFEVFGSDIDENSVNYAKNGVFPIKEVNTIPQQYLNKFWKRGTGAIKEFAAANEQLRKRTKFATLNLLEIEKLPKHQTFDVIFARNIFIYFTEEKVKQIAQGLRNRLNEEGFFASGVSEPLRFDGWNMRSVAPSCYVKDPKNPPQVEICASDVPAISSPVIEKAYRVLCVDDSATIQALLKIIFSKDPNCREVVAAMNGLEARQALDASRFDLITLDIHMPVMDGITFLETAYRKQEDPPVLMVSSVNRKDVDLATKALRLGAIDYVEKPAMNSLQKSVDEIITKAKFALRPVSNDQTDTATEDFNRSIGQKIVVPDASLCLRWVRVDAQNVHLLEPIIKMLPMEYRSPALVISVPNDDLYGVEARVNAWTSESIQVIQGSELFLRPNNLYLVDTQREVDLLTSSRAKKVSLQILCNSTTGIEAFKVFDSLQILLDESIQGATCESLVRQSGLQLSDITPSTSFVSLSLEYFANLRRAEAA